MNLLWHFKFTVLFVTVMLGVGADRIISGNYAWQGIPAVIFGGAIAGAAVGYQRGHRDGVKYLIDKVKRQRLGGP